ncbi:MAG: hypothetical protein ABIR08_02310 [Sphingomonas sp.]
MAVRHFILLALPLALVACGQNQAPEGNLDSLDAELAGNAANANDPAMRAALQDQIMVDPALTGQSNADAIRPPQQPYSGALPPDSVVGGKADGTVTAAGSSSSGGGKPTPAPSGGCPQCKVRNDSVTLGALAGRQGDRRTAACAGKLQYSTGWAQRLPVDLPLYPDARVDEAAGAATGGCALRVVSFSTGASIQTVLDWYYGRATAAGYSAQHQANDGQHVLGGTRRDGAAYVIYLDTRGDGRTEVDIVANNGN